MHSQEQDREDNMLTGKGIKVFLKIIFIISTLIINCHCIFAL